MSLELVHGSGKMAEGIMRLSLSVLDSEPDRFIKCMEECGCVVLTDLGSGEEVHAATSPSPHSKLARVT
jgi:hypothetical protein